MPAAYAHYVFGKKVFQELSGTEKEIIRKGEDAFLLGLHGPDLLFYYFPLCKNRINQQGVKLHKKIAAEFFELGRKRYKEDQDSVLRAYLYGFLCHYILDSECHPYISEYMEEHDLGHLEIETEFDNQLMREDGLDPMHFFTAGHIRPNREFAKIIAPFYENVTADETYGAMRGMVQVHHLLQATSPVKRWVVLTALKAAGTYDVMHGLVANLQPNPRCEASDKELEALYQQALPLAVRLITEYVEGLSNGAPLDKAYDHTFGEF